MDRCLDPSTTRPPNLQAAPFVNIPVELMDEIYAQVPRLVDVMCLSATCQVLWEVGRRNIYRHFAALAASDSWAGDRIICVGAYLNVDEIPESLWTPEERREFLNARRSPWLQEIEDAEAPAPEGSAGKTLFAYPFTCPSWGFDLEWIWFTTGIIGRTEESPYSSSRRGCHKSEFDPVLIGELYRIGKFPSARWHKRLPAPPNPNAKPKVLRNLSRQQYVRESALLALKEKYAGVGIMEALGFGEVLLTRICLSSVPAAGIRYQGELHRGAWAGDRFDVVSEDELMDPDVAWCDVSKEVLKEVEEIWKAQYEEVLSRAGADSEVDSE
ncbi:hypothetical protein C8R46DRAFT_1357695 [Mycena filopes]|nr:hypothetical protein C8R46DRAFT_1357695 [Mycena filopes]